ncbi:MAG: adenosylcobalamin-dependent ribonucleoside-diphosphate reductase [Chloroflexi bacterium]|nr:adenosylcobalamin-dependent ribonucleoside-diphosphate reductase [Chloroflexota bacterium]MDA8186788.1 adenosylcobalamin-dependent ribonucleoside-diphosphate reductase [Dehalococcoidales bacterium]
MMVTTALKLSANAKYILEKRYLQKNEKREVIESPEQLFRRVARNIASVDAMYNPRANIARREEEFYQVMANLEFLPNTPTLMNAGMPIQQLSACFVLPVEDSLESIFDALKNAALIQQTGGGTGFSFSHIRPRGDIVMSTKGIASGPLSFLSIFNAMTETIRQGGTRRGANMGILHCSHPDVLEFIAAKRKPEKLTAFNLSVAVTDEFMRAVEQGGKHALVNPRTGKVAQILSAQKTFDMIVENAWRSGEPGAIFIDEINRHNPTPRLGMIEATNPCGEQPLLPYESCNLGSINLGKMVTSSNGSNAIDYRKLGKTVEIAVRFLDNVVDANRYPLPQIEEMTKGNRKIGLGVMGFADMLVLLGVPYNSERALDVADEVMAFISKEGKRVSAELAKERGQFPNYPGSIYDRPGGMKLRNSTVTTVAPTGTISIIADASSGIEPIFALAYVRRVFGGEDLLVVHPIFKQMAMEAGIYSPELLQTLLQRGSARGIDNIPETIRELFVTAYDISPEWHVRIQAAFQKHVDNAVSKTINLPKSATREDVREAFSLAYKLDCKGITVFRTGARGRQVLDLNVWCPSCIVAKEEAALSPAS